MITLITNIFAVLLTLLPLDIQGNPERLRNIDIQRSPDRLMDIIYESGDTCCTQVLLPPGYNRDMSLDINIDEEKLFIMAILSLLILLFVLVINALIKNSLNRTMAFDLAKYLRQDRNNDRKVMSTIQDDIQKVTEEIKDMRMSLYNLKNDTIEDKRVSIPDFESDEDIESDEDMEQMQPEKSDIITDRHVKKTEKPEFNVNYSLMKAENISEDWNEKASEMWKTEIAKDCKFLKLKFNFYGTEILYYDNTPYTKELCNCFASLFEIDWEIRDRETCPIEYIRLHQLLKTGDKIYWSKDRINSIKNDLGMNLFTFDILPVVNNEDRQIMAERICDYLRKMENLYQDYHEFEYGDIENLNIEQIEELIKKSNEIDETKTLKRINIEQNQ